MARLAKQFLKACSKPVLVLFRPFLRRVDAYLNSHIGQLSAQLEIWQGHYLRSLRDFDDLGDSLVREMARLQLQISLLEENLYEAIEQRDRREAADPGTVPSLRHPPSQAA